MKMKAFISSLTYFNNS